MVIQRSHFRPVLLMLIIMGCQHQPGVDKDGFSVSESGLKYRVIREGSGRTARVGQEILLHEKMFYMNDSLLFDSRQLPNPVKVLIGGNQAIKGIDEALVGMRKGEIKEMKQVIKSYYSIIEKIESWNWTKN